MNNSQNFLEDMDIFEHPSVKAADSNSSILCIFLKAASQFFEKNKYLPQPTRLPDMETNTELFVQLKTVYKQQHKRCLAEILDLMKVIAPTATFD